eukprot:CAMPEP_0174385614 /NCGR_PEP_ID=MMETSP0811_2-20130205/126720_1 /TAXON_ID=73025 ORGANISM="Eutreptiella gymnastica-like, Strain CCMP1594" /NCGR_SAMPLE_ID=MMETSP0811_2 /ASSEMBLY_ACC=CAM_ASM_000667 /LENGTH=227 /DNA_ID=CAMNT_0015539995 /DNA_START=17 /DNA_END=697 /DNA_ORIENTATION=+
MTAQSESSVTEGPTIVCISDTHNEHQNLQVPDGDILIHAGDFTRFGRPEHLQDFNEWLGTLPHQHKIVVYGNHEQNSRLEASRTLTNATFLEQGSVTLQPWGLKVYGTQFCWPCKGINPYWDQIEADTDVLVTHGPALGYVDGDVGCPALLQQIQKVRPRLVVSGHIHGAHGLADGKGRASGTRFVNAAICGTGYKAAWDPLVVQLDLSSPQLAPCSVAPPLHVGIW